MLQSYGSYKVKRKNGMVFGGDCGNTGPLQPFIQRRSFESMDGSFGQVLIVDRPDASYFIYATGSITQRNVHREINERPMTNFVDITRDENCFIL